MSSFGNDHAEPQTAAERRAVADPLADAVGDAQQVARLLDQLAPLGRQPGGASRTIEQFDAERVLELADAHRDARLGGVEPVGGRLERAETGGPVEGLDLDDVHARTPSYNERSYMKKSSIHLTLCQHDA